MNLLRKFESDLSGNVAMMFSVSLVAIVSGVGVAMDYGQMSKAKSDLQNQVDAAVLAAVSVGLREEDGYDGTRASEERIRKAVALEVLKSNGYDVAANPPTINLTDDGTIYAKAELDYQLAFGGLLGADTKAITADSESGLGTGGPVQIALVLDNTLSMLSGGKMTALKTGAVNLTRAIEERGDGSEIAMVPFARYVRIPESLYTASWLELPQEFDTEITWQQATHVGGTCAIETQTRVRDGFEEEFETLVCRDQTTTYETMSRVVESRFEGCVGTRPTPLSELDGSYSNRVPGLLHHIPRQHTGFTYNVEAWCGREITPLTDDFDMLVGHINELYGTDQTYLPSGLLWGQAVLSPGAPFDNTKQDIRKVMVMMTDGRNSAQIAEGQGYEDAMVAPPYIRDSDNEGQHAPDANAATARMCQNIKDDGIEIFTIAFQVDDLETHNLLQACASDPSKAFIAESNDALIARFEHISGSLEGNARLMR